MSKRDKKEKEINPEVEILKEQNVALESISIRQAQIASNLRLMTITLNQSGEAIFWIDEKGKFTYVNDKACEILGYTYNEFLNLCVSDIDPNFPSEKWPEQWEKIKKQNSFLFESTVRTKKGSTFPIEIMANYIKFKDQEYHVAFIRDISQRKEIERELIHKSEFELLVTQISSDFVKTSLDRLDEKIIDSLKKIGEFSEVDRSYLFQFSDNGKLMDNTHEWCREGIPPQIQNLKGIIIKDELPYFDKTFKKHDVFYTINIDELPDEAKLEKEHLKRQDIKSIVAVPIVLGSSLVGLLGFDSVKFPKKWSAEDIALLKIVGEIFFSTIERQNSWKSLEESEEKFRTLAGQSPNMIFINQKGKIVYINDLCEEVMGYSREEFLSPDFDFLSLIAPESLDKVKQNYKKHQEGKETIATEYTVINKQGQRIEAIYNTKIIQYENEPAILGVITDISKRKKIEKSLERRLRLEETVSTISSRFIGSAKIDEAITAAVDDIGNFLKASHSYIFLFTDETPSEKYKDLLADHEIVPQIKVLKNFPSESIPWWFDLLNDDKFIYVDGDIDSEITPQVKVLKNIPFKAVPWWFDMLKSESFIYIDSNVAIPSNSILEKEIIKRPGVKTIFVCPLKIQNNLAGFLVFDNILKDDLHEGDRALITIFSEIIGSAFEQKTSDEKLKIALVKAQEADKTKSQFLAIMSHEIRTPLLTIMGYSDLMDIKCLPPEQRDYLRMVRESSGSLLYMMNNVLELSKIEAGQVRLHEDTYSLEALLNNVGAGAKLLIEQREANVQLKRQIFPENLSSFVLGDQNKVEHIMDKLLDNAIKFTKEGIIEYGVSLKDEKIIEFFVSDTGIGIAEQDHNRIFNAFEQLDMSNTRDYGGTGLGLTIAKKLIEMMGGTIQLTSRRGQKSGSVFSFTLPYKPVEMPEGKKVKKRKIIDKKEITILVVEDDVLNHELIKSIINKAGYNAIGALHGEEAVAIYKSNEIDLILMDIYLPVMGGLEATKIIRDNEALEGKVQIPIIALTAAAMEDDRVKCLKAGCNAYVPKPFNPPDLIEIIEDHLGRTT
ncbi:PAS domain S-box protein [Candidatus Auribacterota bacterium]